MNLKPGDKLYYICPVQHYIAEYKILEVNGNFISAHDVKEDVIFKIIKKDINGLFPFSYFQQDKFIEHFLIYNVNVRNQVIIKPENKKYIEKFNLEYIEEFLI